MSDTFHQIFNTAASGMSAQSIRMNTISSNLANAGSIGSSDKTTYHAKHPVFSEVKNQIAGLNAADQPLGGVQVTKIINSQKPLDKRYEPNNPSADADGYIFSTDVDKIAEMSNMIDASKNYEANVNVLNTAKTMMVQSLALLNSK
jgi:flagellar basal-body rod protein FlgC